MGKKQKKKKKFIKLSDTEHNNLSEYRTQLAILKVIGVESKEIDKILEGKISDKDWDGGPFSLTDTGYQFYIERYHSWGIDSNSPVKILEEYIRYLTDVDHSVRDPIIHSIVRTVENSPDNFSIGFSDGGVEVMGTGIKLIPLFLNKNKGSSITRLSIIGIEGSLDKGEFIIINANIGLIDDYMDIIISSVRDLVLYYDKKRRS